MPIDRATITCVNYCCFLRSWLNPGCTSCSPRQVRSDRRCVAEEKDIRGSSCDTAWVSAWIQP